MTFAMTQQAKDALLRITVYEIVFGDGDLAALTAKKDALLADGAQWAPPRYADTIPTSRAA